MADRNQNLMIFIVNQLATKGVYKMGSPKLQKDPYFHDKFGDGDPYIHGKYGDGVPIFTGSPNSYDTGLLSNTCTLVVST